MNSHAPRRRYLLAQRLLTAIMVMSGLLAIASTFWIYRNTHNRLDEMAVQRAAVIAQSLEGMAKAGAISGLERAITAFNANSNIKLIAVTRGFPAIITVANTRGWRHKNVNQLPDASIAALVSQAMELQKPQSQLNGQTDLHTFVLPIRMMNEADPRLREKGTIIVQTDLSEYDLQGHEDFASTATLGVLLVAGIAGVIYLVLLHSVLAPLTEIYNVIRAREGGNVAARIENPGDDEIGEVAGKLNKLMDVETEAQKKLSIYAEEMEQQNLQLAKARDQAEKATRHKSEFLAMMSHEIRTPMNGIMGTAEILNQSVLNPQQKKQVGMVLTNAELLLDLINGILDFSKIEAGKLELDPQPVSLRTVAEMVAQLLAPRAREKGLELKIYIEENIPQTVLVDVLRLRQVLINLVGNAIKFTSSGAVTIRLSQQALQGGRSMVKFEVVDTGAGISAEKQNIIFEKFTQADVSITRKYGGTGLGLAISCQLVGLMGGKIGVESQEGEGSNFWFLLPLPVVEQPAGGVSLAQESSARLAVADVEETRFTGQHILLVEDNSLNQEFEREMLERMNLVVTWAENGRIALEHAKTTRFDAILMDCQMPEMDGYEATRKLREHEAQQGKTPVRIIALTANVLPEEREKCLRAGMDDYLPKPIRSRALAAMLEKWLLTSRHNEAGEITMETATNKPPLLDEKALAAAQKLMGSRFGQAVALFLEDTARSLETMQNATDARKTVAQAHAIKSTSGYMGAAQVAAAATQLEKTAQEVMAGRMKKEDMSACIAQLTGFFEETRGELQKRYLQT